MIPTHDFSTSEQFVSACASSQVIEFLGERLQLFHSIRPLKQVVVDAGGGQRAPHLKRVFRYADGKHSADPEYVAGLRDLDERNGRTGVTPKFAGGARITTLSHRTFRISHAASDHGKNVVPVYAELVIL